MQPGHTNPSLRGFILVDLLWRNTRSLCQLLNAYSKLAPRQTKARPDKCINSGWLPGDMWVLLQRITSHTTFRQVSNVLWNGSHVSAAGLCRRFERARLQADSGASKLPRTLRSMSCNGVAPSTMLPAGSAVHLVVDRQVFRVRAGRVDINSCVG